MLTKQTLPAEILTKILDQFVLGRISKTAPSVTSGNISYVIKTTGKTYFLRLCPTGPRWRSRQEIAAEIELLDYLKQTGFPVIPPLPDKRGQKIISWGNHYGYLREFSPAKEKSNPSLAEVKKFGEVIGRLHSLTVSFRTKNKRHLFNLAETQKYFNQKRCKILKSNFKDKKQFVTRYQQEIFSLDFPQNLPRGTIHEDLGRRHVLWQESEIAAIVDFDRSYYGFLILDLGEALRGWCFDKNWRKWSNKNFTALISGYQKKRLLTALEKKHLIDAIKFEILERALAFCLRFIEDTEDSADESYAWHSLDNLLPQIETNRAAIEKLLK